MAQLNVYENGQWVATGQLTEGRFDVEAGEISAAAIAAISDAAEPGENGTIEIDGRELTWKAA